MNYSWVPMIGEFKEESSSISFLGQVKEEEGMKHSTTGHLLFNKKFNNGCITAEISFEDIVSETGCQIIVYYEREDSKLKMVTAGIGPFGMFVIQTFDENGWKVLAVTGDIKNLVKDFHYKLKVYLRGSTLYLNVNDVDIISSTIPFYFQQSQVGIWCQNSGKINIYNFDVDTQKPKAFIVMQFSAQYNELYEKVIKRVCEEKEFDIECIRADESYDTGMIILDIINRIKESKIIIAEISPQNPNVYYEVGYSHALNKPTILIAEKGTKLPFDLSPFRVLMYENSISGKERIEESLRKHLREIMFK